MVKVVSFDIGGTLINFSTKYSFKKILLKEFDVDMNILYDAYNNHFLKNYISKQQFCDVVKCKDIALLDDLIVDYYKRKIEGILFDDTLATLKELKKNGFSLITISNKSYCNPLTLKDFGIKEYFDAEIYSCDVGSSKPEKQIFKIAEQVIGADAANIIHIGDSLNSDFLAARSVGWHSIFINRTDEQIYTTPSKLDGCEYAPNLAELPEIIRKLI